VDKLRRRRRGYNNQIKYNNYNRGILLAEFRFYNKKKNIIDDKILRDISTKLKTGNEKRIYWTHPEFAKHNVGFEFFLQHINGENSNKEVYIEILEFEDIKFTAKQFNKIKYIYRKICFSFLLNSQQDEIVTNYPIQRNYNIKKFKVFDTFDEYVSFLISSGNLEIDNECNFKDYLSFLKTLFGNKIDTTWKKNLYHVEKDYYSYQPIYQIFKVLEFRINEKNYRIALIDKIKSNEASYNIKIFEENDENYIYIDEGYMFINKYDKLYFIDNTIKEYKEITETFPICDENGYAYRNKLGDRIYNKETNTKLCINLDIYDKIYNNIDKLMSKKQKIISPMIYRFYKDRTHTSSTTNIYNEQEMAIILQYKKILKNDKLVKFENIKINKNSIEIDGQGFKLEFDNTFLDIIDKFGNVKELLKVDDVRYNFNAFYEGILKLSKLNILQMNNTKEKKYKSFEECSFTVNSMKIVVKKQNNRIKINDVFCRIEDVFYILSKVICYREIEEFNKYVKDVSFIGTVWKQMISNGMQLELNNPFNSLFEKTGGDQFGVMRLRFSLLWDTKHRRNIYLKLGNNKYLIKNKLRFRKYFNFPKRHLKIEQLWIELKECIEDIDDNVILNIIDQAINEAEIVEKRGKELVKLTAKEINAKEIELDINGKKMVGYKLKGRISNSDYFIKKVDLTVYKYVKGSWNRRCVVDDHSKQRIYEDKLANRLVNIYNEPKKIFTLYNI